MKEEFSEQVKILMQLHYSRLSEKDHRQYAVLESLKLGHGGITYIEKVLGIDRKTIRQGRKELTGEEVGLLPAEKQRKSGGGRKKTEKEPEIKNLLVALIEQYKAGSPIDKNVYWVCLKPYAIVKLFEGQNQIKISNGLVKRQLKDLGYGYRKQTKQLAIGKYANRDMQFKIICSLVLIMSLESPVLSIDYKKKEKLGNFYRKGKCFCTDTIKVFDHDY